MTFDPPSPIAVVRGIFGVALAIATAAFVWSSVSAGALNWRAGALILALWVAWGIVADVVHTVLEPLGGFLIDVLSGGGRAITVDEEATMLEHDIAQPIEPEREILKGIRLAEIYRVHRHNKPLADALLDRLLTKYPNARELLVARRTPTG
ncbi:MAG: hypothetical protein ACREL9_02840 [Gemmatimonadales bacterium]